MKTLLRLIVRPSLVAGLIVFPISAPAQSLLASAISPGSKAATNTPAAIPWNEIGTKAGADYKGNGMAVTPTESGASLRCVFQGLDGEATPEGLWLTSIVTNTVSDRFRVTAMGVGRVADGLLTRPAGHPLPIRWGEGWGAGQLPCTGSVSVRGQTVRFSRPGLTEEYSVSIDGVRQDFIVEDSAGRARLLPSRPSSPSDDELVVKLAVDGAQVEPATDGARLVLAHSGRKIAYSRLRVTDATGKELPARIEVSSVGDDATGLNSWVVFDKDIEEQSLLTPVPAREELAVVVNDAEAVYPVRIDPTFSDANWVSMGGFPGAYGLVNAAVVDGSGNLFIGGEFSVVGNVIANCIAQWNGSSWSALGSGITGGNAFYGPYVNALAVSGGTLYAGGSFTTAGGIAADCIAQWNGSSWSALGSGISGETPDGLGPFVWALAVSGSTLYAGGSFTTAGGDAKANDIAQWNGSSWSALGSGMGGESPSVYALVVSGSTLYAGGAFTTAGSDTNANDIAQWNGSSWSALGSGISGDVSALAMSGSTLYACGYFRTAGGNAATNIAQWNGSSWSPLGSGMNDQVNALAVSGGLLYAGGAFTNAGGNAATNIAQWNGSSWSALGSGLSGNLTDFSAGAIVSALAVSGSTVYAGGAFTNAGGNATRNIARWNGRNWSALGSGSGMGGPVSALALSGSTLYAGGNFTMAGGSAANYIAQWNGSVWSALGSGMGGPVFALAVSGSTLYAGGNFTAAGGSAANYIAQWNGSSWLALGPGLNSYVSALALSGTTLYAGGFFTTAGGSAANYIAQWNGTSWSPLGSGLSANPPGSVSALAVSDGTLYAGGFFTTAGSDTNANNIAQWNGTNWSSLGSGLNGQVNALAVSGSTLYAGGFFTTGGGIAQWNGSSWSALGSGINVYASALAVSGSTLYAGGAFTTVGGDTDANYIAQWNGSSWSSLGSGMNYQVDALAVSGGMLYAGGLFTTAGTNVSAYAAMANLAGAPVSLAIITTNAAFGFTNGVFGFDVSGPSSASVVIQTSPDLLTWIPLQTNLLGSSPLHFSDAQPSADRQRFYRAQLSP